MLNQNLLLTGDDGYNLTNSLRFRSSASAYLNRTFTNEQGTYTLSLWVKRGTLGVQQEIVNSRTSGAGSTSYIEFNSSDQINIQLNGTSVLTTTAVYRDPASWYHIVLRVTASATSYLYVNGTQIGSWTAGANPFLFSNGAGYVCAIGRQGNLSAQYFDGYMAEINYIDGQALTPSSFGETDVLTGVWKPKKYAGTYGTNGFYLPFTDNSALTTSSNVGLGKDFSGNGNYWTTNNISITAGATYDSMTDVPTLTNATTANYCVMNPLTTGSFTTLSAANLNTLGNTSSNNGNSRSTFAMQTGKWYFETTLTAANVSIYPQLGIMTTADGNRPNNGYPQAGYSNSSVNPTQSVIYMADGQKQTNGSSSSYGASFTNGDVIGIAIDSDNGAIYFAKNGTWQNSGVPTSGSFKTGAALTWTGSTVEHLFSIADYNGTATATNFGQRPFSYTPPTGFLALNTFNLPNSTIVAGNKQFNAVLWTGDGSTPRSFTGIGFAPDFAWIKSRSTAADHALIDSVRGTGAKALVSNTTSAENGDGLVINSFDSDGYTLATGAFNFSYANTNTASYVSWNWKAGGTAVTNTAGTISAQVSANTTSGFSVVTYTGTGSNATIGHGLGVAPSMFIIKRRNASGNDWAVYHASANASPATGGMNLNTTIAFTSDSTWFNNTAPTSSVFSIGTSGIGNASGGTYVAYCFAPIAGYSAFGSYTGNGSADGPFVFTGFRPRFVMIKRTDSSSAWTILDTARDTFNEMDTILVANDTSRESDFGTTNRNMDFLSNGFKIRSTAAGGTTDLNASGGTYIYMVFAENPFKNSLAR